MNLKSKRILTVNDEAPNREKRTLRLEDVT